MNRHGIAMSAKMIRVYFKRGFIQYYMQVDNISIIKINYFVYNVNILHTLKLIARSS